MKAHGSATAVIRHMQPIQPMTSETCMRVEGLAVPVRGPVMEFVYGLGLRKFVIRAEEGLSLRTSTPVKLLSED